MRNTGCRVICFDHRDIWYRPAEAFRRCSVRFLTECAGSAASHAAFAGRTRSLADVDDMPLGQGESHRHILERSCYRNSGVVLFDVPCLKIHLISLLHCGPLLYFMYFDVLCLNIYLIDFQNTGVTIIIITTTQMTLSSQKLLPAISNVYKLLKYLQIVNVDLSSDSEC